MYIISRLEQEPIVVDTFKAILPAIAATKPGRYVIDEIHDASQPTRNMLRRWGVGIKWVDGSVEIEHDSVEP
jgi:hypothetical protein